MAQPPPKVVHPYILLLIVAMSILVLVLLAYAASEVHALIQDVRLASTASRGQQPQPAVNELPRAGATLATPMPTALPPAQPSTSTPTTVPAKPPPTQAPEEVQALPATIELVVTCTGSQCPTLATLQAVVQQQDENGQWQSVERWQAPLPGDGRLVWPVEEEDLGKGPFRWFVHDGCGCTHPVVSDPFDLPSQPGETVRCDLTVSL